MAKAKKSPAIETDSDEEIGLAPQSLADADADEQENDVIGELRGLGAGDGYKYTVSRVAMKPGERGGYCATYSVGDLSLDSIREQFGGGKYRIRVTDDRGHYVANRTVEIVDIPKRDAPAGAAPAAPGMDLSGIAALLQATRPAGGGATDILPVLVAMMDNQSKMFQAIMSRPQETTKLTDILALINASKDSKPDSAVDMLLKGLELGKELGGGDTGMLDVAKSGLEMLAPMVQQQATHPQPQAQLPAPAPVARLPHTQGPAPAATLSHTQGPAPVAPMENQNMQIIQQLQWLKAQVNVLVNHAARGKDPELYAEVMLDNLPPFLTVQEIRQRLAAPDAVQQLTRIDARVAQFADWFEEFRKAAIELIDEALAPDDDGMDGVGADEPAGDPQEGV